MTVKHLPNHHPSRPLPVKVEQMTRQIRGMSLVLRDNRRAILDMPEAVADMMLAAAELAAVLKQMHMEVR